MLIIVEPNLLADLGTERRKELESRCVRRRFARRQALFHLGDASDGMYLIRTGRISVQVTTPGGDEASLTVIGPGQTVGEQSLILGGRRSASAIALEPVDALFLPRAAFLELRGSDPGFSDLLVGMLAARVIRLTDQLVDALFVPASTRVLHRIADVASLYGTGVIPLTQEEVASIAGTTRPTVNRVLKAAEESGLVSLARGKIRVLDAERLRRAP